MIQLNKFSTLLGMIACSLTTASIGLASTLGDPQLGISPNTAVSTCESTDLAVDLQITRPSSIRATSREHIGRK